MGWGFLLSAAFGIIMIFRNLDVMPAYYNSQTAYRATGRILRSLSEGTIILVLFRTKWDRPMARNVVVVTQLALLAAILEFALWCLPILPPGITHYLTEFRGGFRSLIHGYGGGLMITQVWIFFLAICFLGRSYLQLICTAILGIVISFLSYQRTAAFAVGAVAFILIVLRVRRSTKLSLGLLVVLSVATIGPGRHFLVSAFEDASIRKGSEYFSWESLSSRFGLALDSAAIYARSPVIGIGQSAFTPYAIRGYLEGWIPANGFAKALFDGGQFNISLSGENQFDSHNLWISLITESGIAGFMIVIGMMLLGWRIIIKSWDAPTNYFVLAVVWLGYIISYSSQAEPYTLALLCFLGCLIAAEHERTETFNSPITPALVAPPVIITKSNV